MSISLYTLTSRLHDEKAVDAITQEFLNSIDVAFNYKGDNYDDFGCQPLNIIFVRTGGTEGVFQKIFPQLQDKCQHPFYLLASDKSNSLAASMEILSYLRQRNMKGEIIHGSPEYISQRLRLLQQTATARHKLNGCRLGVIGRPSDWLISSYADYDAVNRIMGIQLIDIPISEVKDTVRSSTSDIIANSLPVGLKSEPSAVIRQALPGANQIYEALKTLIGKYNLQGFTLRCFDLLETLHNTGCMALARLNAEGYVAGCEGDVPTMLTMMTARALLGCSGFQANPAYINTETGEILFAHCTIPFNMVKSYELDTHFESGIGVAIRGYMQEGPVTIFKMSGDLQRHFIAEGELVRNLSKPDLCRTQQVIRLNDRQQATYFLTNPIGNHHVILQGHHKALLEEML